MYQLYYYPNNASLAPHFLLYEMEVEYELLLVDRKSNNQKSADYLRLNPAGRIPTLVDQSLVLFESPAICIYLCEQNPEKELIPLLGNPLRPAFFQWLTFLNNTLQTELMVLYYPHKHTTDESAIPSIKAAQELRVAEALAIIDQQLKDNSYLLGETLSACDFFLFMLAEWSLSIEKSPLSFPHLSHYLRKMATHPTVRDVCEIENIDLTPFR